MNLERGLVRIINVSPRGDFFFVKPEHRGSGDIFVHRSVFYPAGIEPEVGLRVRYAAAVDPRARPLRISDRAAPGSPRRNAARPPSLRKYG